MEQLPSYFMKKLLIILSLALLLLLVYPFSFDYASSVIPGWHTTIYPPYFMASFLLLVLLVMDGFLYWKLRNKNSAYVKKIIVFHFVISSLLILLIKFPQYYLETSSNANIEALLINTIETIKVVFVAFLIVQVLYCVYLFRVIKK